MARKFIIHIISMFLIFVNFPLAVNAEAVSVITVKELIVKHAYEMDLDPALALSIAKMESNYCHNKKSKYGAVGVFQLMPSTAKKMGYNPYHLHDNIKGGISYYKQMYKMFGSTELALAAYNAGPGNVKKYNGVPPFKETRKFVSSIMNNYKILKANSDPVIDSYDNRIKEIANEIREDNFRMQQEAAIQEFLSSQGV